MNIGILLPGFSSDENDAAIPVQLNLVREMAQHHEVRVLALRYPFRCDVYSIYGATVYSLGMGQVRGVGRLQLWLDALLTLRRLHQEKPFDVFHAMWADETGLLAVWAGKLLGVPSVVSIAGGELANFEDIGYGLQLGTFSRWMVRQALEGADSVVVACEYIRLLLAGYRVRRVEKIVLGVDVEGFTPPENTGLTAKTPSSPREIREELNHRDTALSITEDTERRRIIHVASLVKVKDQATLLKAVARLEGVTLDIIGVGYEEQRLKDLARTLGIFERVNFLGAVPHHELPDYYRRAALHVLSSRHEGLGMVTLEAAACGVPSISTNVGLLPDCPDMGVTVAVGDDVALADAIRSLLADEPRRRALGESALNAVRSRYSIQETVRQFSALYEHLKQR
jgi:glycosyltransferase involved in cell wall biosynthesis